MSPPRAVVIGAGIGGLTAALALHRRGWRVTVLERAAGLAPVGAALTLAPNAQRALAALSLDEEVSRLAAWDGDGLLRDPRGRPLARTTSASVVTRFGGPLVVLRRSDLVDLVVDRLPEGTVRTGEAAFLADAGAPGRPAKVSTTGEVYEADLVVCADGVNSASRRVLFPHHPGPAYGGWTVWRILAPTPQRFVPHETWGGGQVWGSLVRDPESVFIYACAVTERGGRSPDGEKAELRRRFGHWHHPVPALLDSIGEEDVLRHDVFHMAQPLERYQRGRSVLLGDAAHAMVPTLGQGANMAIEDSVVLAHHAAPDADVPAALARYDQERRPRTTALIRRAERASRIMALRSPAALALRDGAIRAMAKVVPGLLLRGFDGVADWQPPVTPPGSRPRDTHATG
ncbi:MULTISPECIES: FAD-dependent oxidoreductase [Streptomyces]|uniref:Monooxygenase n=2 Tax=Streptomyces TaxID=1883 RepID=A0A100Y1P4_9ACTN|nr:MULTISPECIES: FAD-dependent oxidoreductase [Streptomyces]KUH36062.1 monooxygenase [Streptomyces kanasensis]UUS31122.1 FAD-dependent oxidoreductase [Streptomyces changanensis]